MCCPSVGGGRRTEAGVSDIKVVANPHHAEVAAHLEGRCEVIYQREPHGTAHALQQVPEKELTRGAVLEVARAVFASFLGIRKGQAMRRDAVTIRPHQVILVAVVLVALFVVSLIVIVRLIIRAAGA